MVENQPTGYFVLGLLRGGLVHLTLSDNYPCQETECVSAGGHGCKFSVRKEEFNDQEMTNGRTRFLTFPVKPAK